jgi:hypothetical protein
MFFVEEIIVMGTVIEVNTHPVKDEEEGRVILQQVVGNIVDDKWKVRLMKVDGTDLTEILSDSSYDK